VVPNEALGMKLAQAAVAEAVGTALLLAAIVGSGIAGAQLAGGNAAIAATIGALSLGGIFVAIIACFGPISGAHFNPVVTLADACLGGTPWSSAPVYIVAQFVGAFAGVAAANLMFGLPAFAISHHARSGLALDFSELIAAFGLIVVIAGCVRVKSSALPFAVGAYFLAASFYTSSGAFANPAVTLSRVFTDTAGGIAAASVLPFIIAQLIGGLLAAALFMYLGRQAARSQDAGS
jgi:glycerol uptake facilitator-like aquaporin